MENIKPDCSGFQTVDKGVPLNTVQALLGHADIQTTLRYVHTQFKKHHEIYDGVNIREFKSRNKKTL